MLLKYFSDLGDDIPRHSGVRKEAIIKFIFCLRSSSCKELIQLALRRSINAADEQNADKQSNHNHRSNPRRHFLWLTSRIRRRRAGSVDDTTDSLRAVACIRFVRPWSSLCVSFGCCCVVRLWGRPSNDWRRSVLKLLEMTLEVVPVISGCLGLIALQALEPLPELFFVETIVIVG